MWNTHFTHSTYISTAHYNGTCNETTDPPRIPCEESNRNTSGHHYTRIRVTSYVLYDSAVGDARTTVSDDKIWTAVTGNP
jgi:hypothetical protein